MKKAKTVAILVLVLSFSIILPLQILFTQSHVESQDISIIKPIENDAYQIKRLDVAVEVGDKSISGFKPSFKLNRWDGECSLSLGFDEKSIVGAKTVKVEEGKVKWETTGFDFQFYASEPWDEVLEVDGEKYVFRQGELGGFGLEIIFKQKPITNQFSFAIQTQGLIFYYQSSLHPDHPTWRDDNDDGVPDVIRPENVVGSYAVYHDTRTRWHTSENDAEKYKSGKAFHIYRPKLIDAVENEAWADIYIDEEKGVLTFTFPQAFLDSATYPVVLGGASEIWGYSESGGSAINDFGNEAHGTLFTSPSDIDTVTSIHTYGQGFFGSGDVKGLIVLHSTLNIISNGISPPQTFVQNVKVWHTHTFSTPPSITPSTDYLLMAIASSFYPQFYYDSASGGHKDTTNNYASPQNLGSADHTTNKFSIYCTYEPVSGNNDPTNDACDSDATFDVDVYGWSNMTVSDLDLVADLKTVDIQVTTLDSKVFTLRWTQSSGVFSEESDSSGICTLDVSGSVRINIDADTDKIAFHFKISVAAHKGACSVEATTTDDQDANDIDNYPSEFSINFYASIVVNDGTHSWTSLSPGDSDILVNGGGGSDGDLDITVSANANFDLQAKGSGALTSGGNTIPLSSVKFHATTLGSATSMTTSYQDIGGLTGQTRGVDLAKSFKLWISVPNPKEVGDYTYTASVQIVEA